MDERKLNATVMGMIAGFPGSINISVLPDREAVRRIASKFDSPLALVTRIEGENPGRFTLRADFTAWQWEGDNGESVDLERAQMYLKDSEGNRLTDKDGNPIMGPTQNEPLDYARGFHQAVYRAYPSYVEVTIPSHITKSAKVLRDSGNDAAADLLIEAYLNTQK